MKCILGKIRWTEKIKQEASENGDPLFWIENKWGMDGYPGAIVANDDVSTVHGEVALWWWFSSNFGNKWKCSQLRNVVAGINCWKKHKF